MTVAPAGPVLALADATAGYQGRALWQGLSLRLAAGQLLAVLGGNGAGKTTLLRVVLGQLRPMAGRAAVLGGPPRRGNPQVGYVPQQRAVEPDLPVRGVDLVRLGLDGHRWGVGWPSRAADQRVAAAVAAVDGTSFARAPFGLLSGGEQQRLRVAQALVGDPRLLLADEPLLSLDLAAQRQVAGLLDRRRRDHGTAVVVVTHDVNPLLPYLDQVLYLAAGRWASGAPDEVLTGPTLSRLYRTDVDVVRVRDRLVVVGAPDAGAGVIDQPHHLTADLPSGGG